jgi:hypothetical protein
MNFFSHYYIDKEKLDPYFLFGTLLPELMPHFNQYLRKAVFGSNMAVADAAFIKIFEGIKRHYEVDKLFHNHDFFRQHTTFIKETILANPQLQPIHYRTFFFAHIALELMIDRLVINAENTEPEKFYQFLNSVDMGIIGAYFTFIGKNEMFPNFLKTYERHIRMRFLYYYHNNEKFTQALLMLYSKINTNMPSLATNTHLTATLLQIEAKLQQEILIFVSEFKKQLNQQNA